MKIARYLGPFPFMRSDARVYALDPSLSSSRYDRATDIRVPATYHHVVVSGMMIKEHPETMIFPAKVTGHLWWRRVEILDWATPLPACLEINHTRALAKLGYELRI